MSNDEQIRRNQIKFFTTQCSIGLITAAVITADKIKPCFGKLCYSIGGFWEILKLKKYKYNTI